MDLLFDLSFFCTCGEDIKSCEIEAQSNTKRDRNRRRGRSRTRRMNINASFDSLSTKNIEKKRTEQGFNTLKLSSEGDRTNEEKHVAKSLKKKSYSEETIKDHRKEAKNRRHRQPPTIRSRKSRNTVRGAGHSKSKIIERENKKHPNLLKYGGKRSSALTSRRLHKVRGDSISRTTQDATLNEGHSKEKIKKSGEEKNLENREGEHSSWNGGYHIPSNRSINRLKTTQGKASRWGQNSKKIEQYSNLVNSEQGTQTPSGNNRTTGLVYKKESKTWNSRDVKNIRKISTTRAGVSSVSTRTTHTSIDTQEEGAMKNMNGMKTSRRKVLLILRRVASILPKRRRLFKKKVKSDEQ